MFARLTCCLSLQISQIERVINAIQGLEGINLYSFQVLTTDSNSKIIMFKATLSTVERIKCVFEGYLLINI